MTVRKKLRVALTPCPNDTYVIGAVATGRASAPNMDIDLELHDIEYLNRAALAGVYDVIKVSCATYAQIDEDYALLDTGAALVEAHGPMVLAREPMSLDVLRSKNVVAPGEHTTATLLFKRWAGADFALSYAAYDEIMDLVAGGEFDAGVIIHEGRFTYQDRGLCALVDLGDWWRAETGKPLALGCYVMRRELVAEYAESFDVLLRQSMQLAASDDLEINAFIRRHAQEMQDDVIKQHIGLYVNDYTRRLGEVGRDAVWDLANCWKQQRVAM